MSEILIEKIENPERSENLDFATKLAKEAGAIMLSHYEEAKQLEWKLPTNFKTEVDDEIDHLVRQRITERYPAHAIYTEEADDKETHSDHRWVVDPLDGTLPYTRGISDHFGICISLVKDRTPILGVFYAPKRQELYRAETGQGAWLNDQPIQVSKLDNINHSMIALDYGKIDREKHMPLQAKLLAQDGVGHTFSLACAGMALSLVAAGKFDGYLALKLEPWDMAACVAIVREAGGKVTDIAGKDWELGDESILAANPNLHARLLAKIRNGL